MMEFMIIFREHVQQYWMLILPASVCIPFALSTLSATLPRSRTQWVTNGFGCAASLAAILIVSGLGLMMVGKESVGVSILYAGIVFFGFSAGFFFAYMCKGIARLLKRFLPKESAHAYA